LGCQRALRSSPPPVEALEIPARIRMIETIMADKKCIGDHQGHLCVLASKELFEKIKELARKPRFICFNCGRVADEQCNLCNPMSLDA
jgi:hypothetical protein